MSKALRYLAAARPEAATHLLGFYGKSVQALDDKTRHLIQIVTKVAVGTERGLRQYAPKALKSGASKEEILDAVLMAFPASGLNKMLDAIDVLRDLDLLPEVPDPTPAPQESADLGAVADFPERKMVCVNRADGDLIVFRTGAQAVKVYRSRCPHSKASLCKGVDHGATAECRVHNWVFDLESGRCLGPDPEGKPGLTPVAASVRDGRVILSLS
ncbi:MAG: Rieske 2Fe-2S domain-containing protein [Magnetococcales bacterium]|nr:Rieske 2Fe-2S domain-containing protein [Magnetococcales bacterium]